MEKEFLLHNDGSILSLVSTGQNSHDVVCYSTIPVDDKIPEEVHRRQNVDPKEFAEMIKDNSQIVGTYNDYKTAVAAARDIINVSEAIRLGQTLGNS
jgi:UDP-N-acetylglucosamine 2-epimerase